MAPSREELFQGIAQALENLVQPFMDKIQSFMADASSFFGSVRGMDTNSLNPSSIGGSTYQDRNRDSDSRSSSIGNDRSNDARMPSQRQLKDIFDAIDQNNNGKLSVGELRGLQNALQSQPNQISQGRQDQIEGMFRREILGGVSFEEFRDIAQTLVSDPNMSSQEASTIIASLEEAKSQMR